MGEWRHLRAEFALLTVVELLQVMKHYAEE